MVVYPTEASWELNLSKSIKCFYYRSEFDYLSISLVETQRDHEVFLC